VVALDGVGSLYVLRRHKPAKWAIPAPRLSELVPEIGPELIYRIDNALLYGVHSWGSE
jgi:hypothetical protein